MELPSSVTFLVLASWCFVRFVECLKGDKIPGSVSTPGQGEELAPFVMSHGGFSECVFFARMSCKEEQLEKSLSVRQQTLINLKSLKRSVCVFMYYFCIASFLYCIYLFIFVSSTVFDIGSVSICISLVTYDCGKDARSQMHNVHVFPEVLSTSLAIRLTEMY